MSKEFKRSFQRAGCYVVSHANSGADNVPRGREGVSLKGGSGVLVAGTVLGQVTATKEFTTWSPAAADGSETVSAILFGKVDTGEAGSTDPVRGVVDTADLVAHGEYLVLKSSITAPQIITLIDGLKTLGILVRNKSDIAPSAA